MTKNPIANHATSEVEWITPSVADNMLKSNHKNRPMRPSHVEFLVALLRRGEWLLNGDAIRFDWNGVLIDGQHRLMAISKSGIAVQSWVMRGLDPDSFKTIDTGSKRSGADMFSVEGEKNPKILASGARIIANLNFVYSTNVIGWKKEGFSNTELDKVVKEHPGLREWTTVPPWLKKNFHSALYCGLGYAFSQFDPVAARGFFERLEEGAGLDKGDAVLFFRNHIIGNKEHGRSSMQSPMAIKTIRTFNYFVHGKKSSRITMFDCGDKFPVIGEKP